VANSPVSRPKWGFWDYVKAIGAFVFLITIFISGIFLYEKFVVGRSTIPRDEVKEIINNYYKLLNENKEYVIKIHDLQSRNEDLIKQNTNLKIDYEKLNTQLAKITAKYKAVSIDYENLSRSYDDLVKFLK